MSVKSEQAIAVDFTTNSSTGAATDADALPVGTLVVDGVDNAAVVTVTNKGTGNYKAEVTLPAELTAGARVQIRIAATVGGVAAKAIIWEDFVDKRVGDLNDLTAQQVADATKLAPSAGDADPDS
ncbi:MAG TPA: hypothetical protein PLS23_22455, partial [Phycisphaerae bacterium]|nr:hypothetical protein [Phycisphaerae bacterium]